MGFAAQPQLRIAPQPIQSARIFLCRRQSKPAQRHALILGVISLAQSNPRADERLRRRVGQIGGLFDQGHALARIPSHQVAAQTHEAQLVSGPKISTLKGAGDVVARLELVSRAPEPAHQHLAHIGHGFRLALFGQERELLAGFDKLALLKGLAPFFQVGHGRAADPQRECKNKCVGAASCHQAASG